MLQFVAVYHSLNYVCQWLNFFQKRDIHFASRCALHSAVHSKNAYFLADFVRNGSRLVGCSFCCKLQVSFSKYQVTGARSLATLKVQIHETLNRINLFYFAIWTCHPVSRLFHAFFFFHSWVANTQPELNTEVSRWTHNQSLNTQGTVPVRCLPTRSSKLLTY